MKTFKIEYIFGNIKESKTITVKNKEELYEYCQKNNYILHKYHEESFIVTFLNNFFNTDKSARKILNDFDTFKIIKALYIMNYAQIPTSRRLKYMQQSVKSKKLTPLIIKWNEYMTDGMEVSEALKLIGLSDYVVHSVKVGSQTGEITEIYKKIMEVLQNKLETRKKIKKLLINPMISLSLLFGMFQFYMFFYYQRTKDILKYMDSSKFPEITNLFLGWSDYAVSSFTNGVIFVVVSFGVFFSVFYTLGQIMKSILKYIPGLKNILVYEDYIIFFSLLQVALSSNILLFRSIELSTEALKNYNLKKSLLKAVEEIESGGVQFSEVAIRNKIFNGDFEAEAAISNFEETTDTKHFEILIEMQKEKLNDVMGLLSAFIQPILLLLIVIAIIVLQYAANAPMWSFGESSNQ